MGKNELSHNFVCAKSKCSSEVCLQKLLETDEWAAPAAFVVELACNHRARAAYILSIALGKARASVAVGCYHVEHIALPFLQVRIFDQKTGHMFRQKVLEIVTDGVAVLIVACSFLNQIYVGSLFTPFVYTPFFFFFFF